MTPKPNVVGARRAMTNRIGKVGRTRRALGSSRVILGIKGLSRPASFISFTNPASLTGVCREEEKEGEGE
eukprot:3619054-Pyramimonas_sp.AAC.1